MKIYKVGGAVRDQLLGITPRDRDYLVVGATPEEMKKQGYIQVGQSYEVFLHPRTREEYVLATSLEEDLKRRDLTINAMAVDEEGKLHDPFGGQEDLKNKILRHTSHHFADDPLRVYRLARFKAQFPDFSIDRDTLALAYKIDTQGLNGERILGELKRALLAERPEEFFNTLELFNLNIFKDWSGLNQFRENHPDLTLIFAWLVRNYSSEDILEFARKFLIENDWIEAGKVSSKVNSFSGTTAQQMVNLFYEIDAFRKPYLIAMIEKLFPEAGKNLTKAYQVVSGVTVRDVASDLSGKDIGEAIKLERIKRLETL